MKQAGHSPVLPDTVWILEQIPGYTRSGDVSDVVNDLGGYWPSYNIPFFTDIYDISGYPTMNTSEWSYANCSRANIFRARAPKVASVADMEAIMTYNNWQSDPLSGGDPSHAIASRYDLRTVKPAVRRCLVWRCVHSWVLVWAGVWWHRWEDCRCISVGQCADLCLLWSNARAAGMQRRVLCDGGAARCGGPG
jgi:hypothetical protein